MIGRTSNMAPGVSYAFSARVIILRKIAEQIGYFVVFMAFYGLSAKATKRPKALLRDRLTA